MTTAKKYLDASPLTLSGIWCKYTEYCANLPFIWIDNACLPTSQWELQKAAEMPREITTKQRVWQKGRGFAWLTKCCFGLLISAPLILFTCHLLKNSMQQGFVVGNNHFLHRMIYQSEWHFSRILFCIYFIAEYNLKSKQNTKGTRL